MKFIINADDFGLNHEVNMGVVEAFQKGYISNTTIMVNMPGFGEAVGLAKKYGFFDKVGLHLNLFEGMPLTDEIRETFLVNPNSGEMTSYRIFHELHTIYKFHIDSKTRTAITKEATAQMKKYASIGFSEMHLDSHGHSHTIWSFYKCIEASAIKMGFKTQRLSLNFGRGRRLPVKVYKDLYNQSVKRHFASTDYFTSTDEFFYLSEINNKLFTEDKVCEIMTHPIMTEEGLMNMKETNFEKMAKILHKGGVSTNII